MTTPSNTPAGAGVGGRWPVLAAALIVATAAGVATAHGLDQVAAASGVPAPLAWLYPVITDGLALVAYAATTRLHTGGRRYAAGIVVLAAGLSGLAQAVHLAGGIDTRSIAPVGLRFGVGAWPAIAAALTAHLLHLVHTDPTRPEHTATAVTATEQPAATSAEASNVSNPAGVQPSKPAVEHSSVQPARTATDLDTLAVQPPRSPTAEDLPGQATVGRSGSAGSGAPSRDRAQQTARSHYAQHGRLPTVTELAQAARVARGTAGTVLKELRDARPALHVVTPTPDHKANP